MFNVNVHGKNSSVGVEGILLHHPACRWTKNSARHVRIKEILTLLRDMYVSLGRKASKKRLVVILNRRHGVCVTIGEGGESEHRASSTWCQVNLIL